MRRILRSGLARPLALGAGLLLLAGAAVETTGSRAVPVEPQKGRGPKIVPAKGVFLVAEPDLGDPWFRESVVLLLAHGETGTLGLVVNRLTTVTLSEALPELEVGEEGEERDLYFGGPVALEHMLFLVRTEEPWDGASQVVEDVYFSGDRDALVTLLKQKKDDEELRLYMGHAGWAPGQLAREIELGSWQLVRATADRVFEKDVDTLWRSLVERGSPVLVARNATRMRRARR